MIRFKELRRIGNAIEHSRSEYHPREYGREPFRARIGRSNSSFSDLMLFEKAYVTIYRYGQCNELSLVLVVCFFALSLSVRIGVSFRKRRRNLEQDERDSGVIEAATLTLLSLIIGFSFSMAMSRYEQRKNYEAAEANAIGTEYVRA